jgi:hypothetical protein
MQANTSRVIHQIVRTRLDLGLAADLNQGQETEYQMLLIWEQLLDPKLHNGTYHYQSLLEKLSQRTPASISARFLERMQHREQSEPEQIDSELLSAFRELLPAKPVKSAEEQRNHELLQALFPYWELYPDWQAHFVESPTWELRYWLALKPETTRPILQQLTRDGHRLIRAAADYWLQQHKPLA